ncbi:putative short-chain dehydrogenases/reductase [Xylaria castorea]|nr:putative short-chain dehydrogenases/reductase [Xylaria castorea]
MPKKTVLITGCSHGGLGAAMAKVYRAKGFKVFAAVRNAAKAGTLKDTTDIEIIELEVTSKESIQGCAREIEKFTGGSLDILVNNAGVSAVMPLLDLDLNDAKRLYDVNVWAQLAMVQAFAPMLIKAKGTVCNVSSVSGELISAWGGMSYLIPWNHQLWANNYVGSYNSSRAATTALSETLRIEMAPLGVRVVTVVLAAVETSGNDPSMKGDIKLPENSYYQNIRDVINHHYKGLVYTKKQNVDVAANNIVNDLLKGGSIFIRRGESSTLSWYCSTFLPHAWFTSLLNGGSGLAQLKG